MDKYSLPEVPIFLGGIKVCEKGDKREVADGERFCGQHGGKPLSIEALRRTIHRCLRGGIHEMQRCENCVKIPLNQVRCLRCAWMRGAAMGIAGIAEEMGWAEEVEPYMKMIGVYSPGWQREVFR